jgi:hypothetical protein
MPENPAFSGIPEGLKKNQIFFEKVLDLALNCNDSLRVRRKRYDYDPGFRQALRMQYPDAALL